MPRGRKWSFSQLLMLGTATRHLRGRGRRCHWPTGPPFNHRPVLQGRAGFRPQAFFLKSERELKPDWQCVQAPHQAAT
jgi:hypothetical protein